MDLGQPVEANDAATKKYVDDATASIVIGTPGRIVIVDTDGMGLIGSAASISDFEIAGAAALAVAAAAANYDPAGAAAAAILNTVRKVDYVAKGAIQVASNASTPANFPAGNDGQIIVAHNAEGQGLIWLDATPGLLRNAMPNPQFEINLRGVASYTSGTVPLNNNDTWLIDQTLLLSDGNNIVSVAKETSVVPASAPSALRFTQVTINKKSGYLKIIESKDALKFAGRTVSYQLKAATKNGNVINNIRAAILTRTGTADSLTSNPVSAWGAQGTNPTFIAEWTARNVATNFGLTASYQTFKIENVAIPAGITNLAIMVWVDDTDAAVGDIVYFGDEQLNDGPVCLPFMPKSYQEALAQCRRFLRCWGGAGNYERIGSGGCVNTTTGYVFVPLDTPMRATPVLDVCSAAATFAIQPLAVACSAAPTIDAAGSSERGVNIGFTVAAGLTAGQAAILAANNSASMYFRITCEL